jgi:hypothetical protein
MTKPWNGWRDTGLQNWAIACIGHPAKADNAGKYMLFHRASSTVLLGAGFTASIEEVLEFLERERTQLKRKRSTKEKQDAP